MTPYIEGIANRVENQMTLDEVKHYFNNECRFAKSVFGPFVAHFVLTGNYDILNIILHSPIFKEHFDCVDEFGEPTLHNILYAITILNKDESEVPEALRLEIKEGLMKILLDETIPFDWSIIDPNNDNPIHIAITHHEAFTDDELLSLINRALNENVNPLNKNDLDENAIDTALNSDNMDDTLKQKIISILAMKCDQCLIEIPNSTYAE